MKKKVVLVTTTKYNHSDILRFRLATQMVFAAKSAGYPVVIVDGSTNRFVRPAFEALEASVYLQHVHGMGASRRQAFFLANEKAEEIDADIILWLEPEKVGIVDLVERIIEPIVKNKADIVIPARSAKSWATYPAPQQESEKLINAAYGESMSEYALVGDFDPAFGPVAFHCSVVSYFLKTNGRRMLRPIADTYITHYAPMFAYLDGEARLASVEVDFEYPREQRQEEEGLRAEEMKVKRRCQREELIAGYDMVLNTFTMIGTGR